MQLYVDKGTDQMRSTFTAIGLAQLLYDIPSAGSGQKVWIKDLGSCYLIESKLSQDMLRAEIERKGFLPPLLPAFTKPLTEKEKKQLETGTSAEELLAKYVPRGFIGQQIDYETAKEIADAAKKQKAKDKREEGEELRAHPDFPVWAHLCSYFGKGSAMRVGYPSVLHAWHAHSGENALLLWDILIAGYHDFPNDLETARRHWNEELRAQIHYVDYEIETTISSLAIVSPSTSKGVSATTGYNGLVENTPPTFWLEMYVAFAGFMGIAMPFTIGSDVVTYYPLPRNIELKILQDIMSEYRNSAGTQSLYRYSNSMNRAKLDVLNQLHYYRKMLGFYAEAKDYDFEFDAISGIVGYYYKDISSQIPFDETLFLSPAWISSDLEADDLYKAEALVGQHFDLINAIRGKAPKYKLTADELVLFTCYRRYSTHGEAFDWIEFAIAYGMYRFRNMTDAYLPPLSLDLFKESFPMSNLTNDKANYRPILENAGFERLASAISYCTSYARYMRDVKKDRTFPFQVQHGLGDDLLRNAHSPELFLADLSQFIYRYRSESMKVYAETGKQRTEIKDEDVAAIVGLVADYGSNIVAHLLVASGYAARYGSND